ncbi:MAG: hypothetical protein IT292_09945 [Deltaproteobacteria bacterium]|nr:hypothetical protein [Deltaproteobacteria bacterium]
MQKGVTCDYTTTEDELIAAYHPKKIIVEPFAPFEQAHQEVSEGLAKFSIRKFISIFLQ